MMRAAQVAAEIADPAVQRQIDRGELSTAPTETLARE